MLIEWIYGLFFLIALVSALMVVLARHAVYSALYLVVTMIAIAGLFVMMNAQLAAAFQVIVYAGAIMVLFLFVIMLLSLGRQGDPPIRTLKIRWLGLALTLALIVQLFAAVALFARQFQQRPFSLQNAPGISIEQVAHLLVTDYLYAFEMTSVLLLIAVIGSVVLARRKLEGPESPATGERGEH